MTRKCFGVSPRDDRRLQALAQSKGVSRRTSQRTVQQAYALIREDIDQASIQRTDLVAQAIHLLMESARVGLKQNNPGAVVGASTAAGSAGVFHF